MAEDCVHWKKIVYTDFLPTKLLRAMKLLNIKAPTRRVFHHYQTKHLHGVSSILIQYQFVCYN